jgi:hypothetical protein
MAGAEKAFSFLVGQLHALADSANGYPRNPIEGRVWTEGRRLTAVCDEFADAVSRWQQREGEEQATRLAASMAMQILADYPEEIFPRVLRNAKCCESLGMINEAADGYRCIVADFGQLDLEDQLNEDPLEGSWLTIVESLNEALAGLHRLSPEDLTPAEDALRAKVNAALAGSR